MKKQGKNIASLLLLLVMLVTSVGSLSGCSFASNAPSVSIVGTEINADGELIIRYSNGLRDNLGVVVGKDGTADAATVISAEINEKGELILHYSDATMQNLGLIGGNNVDVDIEITGEAEGVAAAVSAAAPSVVSLLCSFTNVSSYGISVSKSASAGVIYSLNKETGDALIVTNYHPVYEFGKLADRITVNVFGSPLASQAITATFVGGSMQEDIAVLRVQGSEFLKNSVAKAATLASVDSIYAGDTAIAIGNPSGKGISATYGKVNVVTERMETTASDGVTEVTRRVMRIDTAVNKGNSGGGLFDSEGRLIGIVSAKIIEENIENIGFAFPVDKVQALVDNIVYYCLDGDYITPFKPTLGVKMQVVDSAAVLNESTGLFETIETIGITDVLAGSAADGFCEVGDRLLSIRVDDYTVEVTRLHHLTEATWRLRPGQTFYLKVLRDGEEIDLEIIPENSAYNPC